jgi:phosphoribosylformylglycinamidine (FGAM) synthase-like enzyme
VASTTCLNFGNPEKPEIMAQLSGAIDGIAEACTALGTPITGGNVSLYNETKGEGIYPTPVIGVVGILEEVAKAVPADFVNPGDVLLLLEAGGSALHSAVQELGSSAFARTCFGATWGSPPSLELEAEKKIHAKLHELASAGLLTAARPVSDGGLAVTLAEGCFSHNVGIDGFLQYSPTEPAYIRLFAERASQVVLACQPELADQVRKISGAWELGQITDGLFRITFQTHAQVNDEFKYKKDKIVTLIDTTTAELRESWSNALQSTLSVDTVTA